MAGFGEFGIKAFADHRGVIYGSVSALMVLVWILLIVAMAGGSTDGNTIQNCAWSIYSSPAVLGEGGRLGRRERWRC